MPGSWSYRNRLREQSLVSKNGSKVKRIERVRKGTLKKIKIAELGYDGFSPAARDLRIMECQRGNCESMKSEKEISGRSAD